MRRLILASRSPQRRAILEQLGVPFTVVVPEVEELVSGDPVEVAVENARSKALAATAAGSGAAARSASVVLGVDTIVVLDGVVYGKPADGAAARGMLGMLSGRVHEVVSGVCVVVDGEERVGIARTAVRFRELGDGVLDWYLGTGEWRERAGGYAIQGRGAALVAGIEGDYLNVVGLPVTTLLELLPALLQDAS